MRTWSSASRPLDRILKDEAEPGRYDPQRLFPEKLNREPMLEVERLAM